MESTYRTNEQFEDLCDSMINGNWTQAGEDCAKYGFWANDLIEKFEEESYGIEATDLAILVEIANKYRDQIINLEFLFFLIF